MCVGKLARIVSLYLARVVDMTKRGIALASATLITISHSSAVSSALFASHWDAVTTIPSYTDAMDVKMSGMIVQGEIVSRCPKVAYKSSFYGGQVVRVWVVIHGNGSPNDGRISIKIN